MKTSLQKYRRLLFLRIAVSVVSFGIFVALDVTWILTRAESLRFTLLLPFVVAVFVLPRKIPTEWEGEAPNPEEQEGLDRTRRWLSYVRVIYLVLAVLMMLVLPEILF